MSRRTLVKHTGSKAAYKIPKTAGKQSRYINSLTALLSLSYGATATSRDHLYQRRRYARFHSQQSQSRAQSAQRRCEK